MQKTRRPADYENPPGALGIKDRFVVGRFLSESSGLAETIPRNALTFYGPEGPHLGIP